MKKNKGILKAYLVVFMIIIFSMVYIVEIANEFNELNIIVLFTFSIVGLLSMYNIFSSLKYEASLYKMNGYFFLIFMFLAPMYQYAVDNFPWGLKADDHILVITNLILIIWLVVYTSVYQITHSPKREGVKLLLNNQVMIIGFILTIFSGIIMIIYSGGIAGLFYRSSAVQLDQSIGLIITRTIRPFSVLFLVYLVILMKNKKAKSIQYNIILITTLIIVLLTNFPTGVPRFHAAAVYIGLMLFFFKDKLKFDFIFLIGIIVIFPVLDNFRNTRDNLYSSLSFETINFATGHYDAYSMLVRTIEYVSINGPTYGNQLLGSIFFFIPRTIWSTKPVGSGWTVGDFFGLSFLNISSPIVAEAIINFGLILFILFAVLLGIMTKRLDELYWMKADETRYIDIYYIFLIGFFFFILRGDMLSTLAFTIAFLTPLILLFLVTRMKLR